MNQYNIGVIENEIGIISDTHFRHGNIIRYCGRPVRFERKIINNCAFLFKSTKTVVHLGDFGFFNNRKKALWYFDKIFPKDSQKILVIGNHDKRNKSVMRLPWDMKCDTLRFEYNGLKFLCKHRPFGYKRWWQWFFKYDIPDDVDIAIHGHIHEKGMRYSWKKDTNTLIVNACVEHWNYMPLFSKSLAEEYYERKSYYQRRSQNERTLPKRGS